MKVKAAILEARAGFIHRQREPRYFVVRLGPHHRKYRDGYRFAVQLLNEVGEGEAVLYFTDPSGAYESEGAHVPAEVMRAATRQIEGQGDYVDSHGTSRAPFWNAQQRFRADAWKPTRRSKQTLGCVKTIPVLCLIAGAALTSCSDSGNGLATDPDLVFSLCSFPAIAAGRVGTKIRIRGRLTSHAHGLLLSDERCPDVLVHLDIAPDAPDFCGPQLVQQFGCPPGAGEPFVTAVGVLTNATEPKNAILLFNQLVDVERVPAEGQ